MYTRKWPRRGTYAGMWGHYCAPEWYRVLRSFKYNGQPKKEKDTVKEDWWRKKGFLKDRRKYKWQQGWKRDTKHYSARNNRALERRAISSERYDQLHRLTYKFAEDPWGWD